MTRGHDFAVLQLPGCSSSLKPSTRVAFLQRESFYDYLPAHMNGVALIILVSSINAVCYNMVRARAGEGARWMAWVWHPAFPGPHPSPALAHLPAGMACCWAGCSWAMPAPSRKKRHLKAPC